MKIINTNDSVNFVDCNNGVVGYDTSQNCCERAGYSIRFDEPTVASTNEDEPSAEVLEPYNFDPAYFTELSFADDYEDGGAVCFKLVAQDKQPLYLMLFNAHNGYYSHGFTVDVKGLETKSGFI